VAPLDRIEVKGYKSIREAALDLRPLNVLIGPNGAGKSNLVSVFEMVRQIEARRLQTYVAQMGGANSLLHYGRHTTESIEIGLALGGGEAGSGYRCVLVPTAQDGLAFATEEVWEADLFRNGSPYVEPLGRGHLETRLHNYTVDPLPSATPYVLRTMQSWRVYHFHDTSESSKMRATGDLDDNAFFRDDASNLAAYLYLLREQEPDSYERIVATIQMVAPFFYDFALRPNPLNPRKIRLEWRDRGSEDYFDAHSLSDGTLRFICLVILLLMPYPPDTILIDEPELGLHPYAIAVLAGLLRSAATRTQIIVSTQSVTLLNQLEPEDVIVVDRENGASRFHRLDQSELDVWLEGYSLGELWEKNLLGGRPR
jgi:predicted ATPase